MLYFLRRRQNLDPGRLERGNKGIKKKTKKRK